MRNGLIGAALVLGWCARDLAHFAVRAEPALALRILPDVGFAVLVGAVLGALMTTRWVRFPLIVIALAGVVAPPVRDGLALFPPGGRFPGAIDALAFMLVSGLLVSVATAKRGNALPAGFAFGVLGSTGLAALRVGPDEFTRVALVAASLVIVATVLPRGGVRRAVLVLCFAAPCILVGWIASDRLALPRPDQPAAFERPLPAGPSLLLITLDTLRCDRLPAPPGRVVIAPHLEAYFRSKATHYPRAIATSSWTLPSHASLLTGLYPSQHGATLPRSRRNDRVIEGSLYPAERLRPDATTLAEVLSANGHRTAAIVANQAYLAHDFGLDHGFEHYDDRRAIEQDDYATLVQLFGRHPALGWKGYRDGETITDLALRWLDARTDDRAFFLFLNYMDAHNPYAPPPPFDRAFGDDFMPDPMAKPMRMAPLLYDREVAYLDAQVWRLLEGLEARGLLDDLVLVLTSDHGEAFGEHASFGHGRSLYEEVICVPLFVKTARSRTGRRDDRPIDGSQVFALALSQLGIESPAREASHEAHGELFTYGQRDHTDADLPISRSQDLLSWTQGRHKLIVSSTGEVWRFDLESDPDELSPLPMTSEDIASARARARRWWDDHPPITSDEEERPSEELLDRLRQLGYIE